MKGKGIKVLLLLLFGFCQLIGMGQHYHSIDLYVKQRNLLEISLNSNDRLFVKGRPNDVSNIKLLVKTFMTPDIEDEWAPEVEIKSYDLLGNVLVTKGIVSFQCHSDSQDAYLEVIYEIARAFLEVRETLAWKKFHKHLYELTEEQRESIGKAIPVRVVELTEFVGAYDGIQLVADDVEVYDVEINNRFIQRCMEQLIRAGDCELWY